MTSPIFLFLNRATLIPFTFLYIYLFLTTNYLIAGEIQQKAALVVVIDDIGHQRAAAESALSLPGKVTLAILPFTPFSREIAARAADLGKEIILHSPMSSKHM